MGSSYFGEPNFGRERSGGGSSSSSSSLRKGKKSNSDKPKQPQRGLGVAQLEKIRLHSKVGSAYNVPSFQSPYLMTHTNQEDIILQTTYSLTSSSFPCTSVTASSSYGYDGPHRAAKGLGDMERGNVQYGDSQPNIYPPRWNAVNLEGQHYQQPSSTRPFLGLDVEETIGKKKKKDRSHSNGSAGSSGSQELDLELRLSI